VRTANIEAKKGVAPSQARTANIEGMVIPGTLVPGRDHRERRDGDRDKETKERASRSTNESVRPGAVAAVNESPREVAKSKGSNRSRALASVGDKTLTREERMSVRHDRTQEDQEAKRRSPRSAKSSARDGETKRLVKEWRSVPDAVMDENGGVTANAVDEERGENKRMRNLEEQNRALAEQVQQLIHNSQPVPNQAVDTEEEANRTKKGRRRRTHNFGRRKKQKEETQYVHFVSCVGRWWWRRGIFP